METRVLGGLIMSLLLTVGLAWALTDTDTGGNESRRRHARKPKWRMFSPANWEVILGGICSAWTGYLRIQRTQKCQYVTPPRSVRPSRRQGVPAGDGAQIAPMDGHLHEP